MFLRYFLIFTICFFCTFLSSAEADLVSTEQAKINLVVGKYNNNGSIEAGLHYKLEDGWKIYWREPGETGFPPQITWQESANISSLEMLWPAPKRNRYKLADDLYTESNEYSNEVLFPLTFTTEDSNKEAILNLHVDFAICNEICIPDSAKFNITVPKEHHIESNLKLIDEYKKYIPQVNGTNGISISKIELVKSDVEDEYLKVTIDSKEISIKDSSIFIEGGNDFAFYNPSREISNDHKNAIFNVPFTSYNKDTDIKSSNIKVTLSNGINSIEREIKGEEIEEIKESSRKKNKEQSDNKFKHSTLLILLFAFVGGLILNIMPCVLPVLSIKLLSIIKHGGGDKSHVATNFLITALGIITSFLLLGIFVHTLKTIGVNVGWGFHFQEPLFIITLIIILSAFSANMWGLFELRLPSFVCNKAVNKCEGDNKAAHFFTGVFATILATPCTAPFLGTAVGFAITSNFVTIFLVFLMMGIGMSTPYIILSIFPNVITKLPKPGNWMVITKYILGCFVALTAVWLIWVLSNQIGNASAIILSMLILLILYRLKTHKSENYEIKSYIAFIIAAFITPVILSQETSSNINDNGIWETFNEKKIERLVKEGKTVFVDVTADWCLTCKVNKSLVLDTQEIEKAFKDNGVIAIRADWTNKDDNIGQYLKNYDRAGIPFNIIYGPKVPKGIIMSELLNKQDIISSINEVKGK